MHVTILIVSLALQLANVVLALRLILLTGRRTAWLLMSIALGLMASRRMSGLYQVLTGTNYFDTSPPQELLAITISILLFISLWQLQPLFMAMKRNEQAIRESEAQYRSLMENSPLAVMVCQQGYVSLANDTARKLCGVESEAQLTGRPFVDLFDPTSRDQILETTKLVEQGKPQPTLETQIRRNDNVRVDIELVLTRFVFAGQLTTYAVLHDVSARRRHEEALRDREAELAHINRLHTMGEITAELAHEINQPLYAISNFAQAAALHLNSHDPHRRPEIERCLTQVATQAERAAQIVRKLRGYMGKSAGEAQVVSLSAILRDAMSLVTAEARRFGCRTELKTHAEDAEVRVEPVAIQQVLVNLLCNAYEAMNVVPKSDRLVTIATMATDGHYEISIIDRGPGMPSEQLARVFDPYFTTKSHGMGMGLAVCRTIITNHGGRIWAEPNGSHGLRFAFTLPRDTAEEPNIEGAAQPAASQAM